MTRRPSWPLDRLGQLLAPAGSGPGSRARFDPDQMPEVLSVADRHNLVPALWSALLAAGFVDPVPSSVLRFAGERSLGSGASLFAAAAAHAANADRVDDLLVQSGSVLAALADADVPAAPLKGIDAVMTDRYPDPASRTMTDIDILVDPSRSSRAAEVLADLGYRSAGQEDPADADRHQLTAVALPGRVGSVEIHTALATARWASTLDPEAVLSRATRSGVSSAPMLSRTDSATHLVLHAQLHDEAYLLGRLPLRALHETSLLIAHREPVDWGEVDARFAAVGRRAALRSHLHLTSMLFGVASPLGANPVTSVRSRGVKELDALPRTRSLVGQVAYSPRSLGAERMRDLYGADDSRAVWLARAGHISRSARTRLQREPVRSARPMD